MEIELNKTYNLFDDGKIRESRRSSIIITEIIPFNEISKELLLVWKEEVINCYWLYAKKTDFFLKGHFKDFKDIPVLFVRTLDNGWYSIWNTNGRLDVDGSLMEILKNRNDE